MSRSVEMTLREISRAKWSYVTRRVATDAQLGRLRGGTALSFPKPGDLVLATVRELGEHEFLEDTHGRRLRLYPGDLLVGAYGSRYATDFYEGYVPRPHDSVHLLTSGGLIGTVASRHTSRGAPTQLEVLGSIVRAGESVAEPRALSLEDFAVAPAPTPATHTNTIVVLGTAMNAGKTTTTCSVIHGLHRAGLHVGGAKVTGSGSGNDLWAYVDAGAATVTDFVDFGIPSTFGYPVGRLIATMSAIRDRLVDQGANAVVLEIADGVLHTETRDLAATLPQFADKVILAAGDALGALAAVEVLTGLGVTVDAISGLVTASPLASRELAAATSLPVLNRLALVNDMATGLLTSNP